MGTGELAKTTLCVSLLTQESGARFGYRLCRLGGIALLIVSIPTSGGCHNHHQQCEFFNLHISPSDFKKMGRSFLAC